MAQVPPVRLPIPGRADAAGAVGVDIGADEAGDVQRTDDGSIDDTAGPVADAERGNRRGRVERRVVAVGEGYRHGTASTDGERAHAPPAADLALSVFSGPATVMELNEKAPDRLTMVILLVAVVPVTVMVVLPPVVVTTPVPAPVRESVPISPAASATVAFTFLCTPTVPKA